MKPGTTALMVIPFFKIVGAVNLTNQSVTRFRKSWFDPSYQIPLIDDTQTIRPFAFKPCIFNKRWASLTRSIEDKLILMTDPKALVSYS